MERFLPSETARLVLGYLKSEGCHDAFQAFLAECPHLKEYAMLLERGREYTTKVNGKTLEECLDEFADLKRAVTLKTNLSQHYLNAGGEIRRVVLDTPASEATASGSAFGSAYFIDDETPGAYARNEVPNPCLLGSKKTVSKTGARNKKKTVTSLNKKGKSISSERGAYSKRTCSRIHKDFSDSEASENQKSNSGHHDHRRSKNFVKKMLFDSDADGCRQCSKNQSGRVRKKRRSKPDHVCEASHKSVPIESHASCSRDSRTLPRVRLKLGGSCRAVVISSDAEESADMDINADYANELATDTDIDVGHRGSDMVGKPCHVQEEVQACDDRDIPDKAAAPTCTDDTASQGCSMLPSPVNIPELRPLSLFIPDIPEAPPTSLTPVKDIDGQSLLSTPSKFNDTASIMSVGRSPKRKSQAPKRRFNKPPAPRPNLSYEPGEDTLNFTLLTDEALSVDMSHVLEKLLGNTQLQQRLAENINKAVVSQNTGIIAPVAAEPSQNTANTAPVAAEPSQNAKPNQSLESLLNIQECLVSDETIGGIMTMTKDDPTFDTLFDLFNVDKGNFIETQYKQPGAQVTINCDVNANVKGPTGEGQELNVPARDNSASNTLLDRLDAMVSAVDNQSTSDPHDVIATAARVAGLSENQPEIVNVLSLPSPKSMQAAQVGVSSAVTYEQTDQPLLTPDKDSARENVSKCSRDVNVKTPLSQRPSTPGTVRNTELNSSDENVRHFSREMMDLKSPYLSHVNSPVTVDVEAELPMDNDVNNAVMTTAAQNSEDVLQSESIVGETLPDTCDVKETCGTPLNEAQLARHGEESVTLGLKVDGAKNDSKDVEYELVVLGISPVPANVKCVEFSSVSFESDHSKSMDANTSKDSPSFTKPQSVKPRRVALTTLCSVPSPQTPAGEGHSVRHFGQSPVPSPFLSSPFSPQTPLMPEATAAFLYSPSPATTGAIPSKQTPADAEAPSPATKTDQSVKQPPLQECSMPSPSQQLQRLDSVTSIQAPRTSTAPSTSLPSPFLDRPLSPQTPAMASCESPKSQGAPDSPFMPHDLTDSSNEEMMSPEADYPPAAADPSEVMSMSAEFTPSKPLTTSTPATPIRSKHVPSAPIPLMQKLTPEKTITGAAAKLASPSLHKLAASQASRMSQDGFSNDGSTTPARQLPKVDYITPNKGPGSVQSNSSPYATLRMTPVQTTDEDYSQHQNVAVESIMGTPRKKIVCVDDDEDVSNGSDESFMSVATVIKEEQRLAIDAILQPSPAKSTCLSPKKLFQSSYVTPTKSFLQSPASSPRNFNRAISKVKPVVFKIPDANSEKFCPSPLKSSCDTHSSGGDKVEGNTDTDQQKGMTISQVGAADDEKSQQNPEGGNLNEDAETSGNEINASAVTSSSSLGLPSDVGVPITDQQHANMMDSISSESLSAFHAFVDSIPDIGKVKHGQTSKVSNVLKSAFEAAVCSSDTLVQNVPVSAQICKNPSTNTEFPQALIGAKSGNPELTEQEFESETALLAEVRETLALIPKPIESNVVQDFDVPFSASGLVGFTTAQEQMSNGSQSVSHEIKGRGQKSQNKRSGSRSHSRTSSASDIGTAPALSYPMPIPTAIDLQNPEVRVLNVKTQKGKFIPIFLTPLDTSGDQNVCEAMEEPGVRVIPVEAQDIDSPEARLLLEDNSQSLGTIFKAHEEGPVAGLFGANVISGQTEDTCQTVTKKNKSCQSSDQTDASEFQRPFNAGQSSNDSRYRQSSSSQETLPDKSDVKQGDSRRRSSVGLSHEKRKGRKRRNNSSNEVSSAKRQRVASIPVDDCDNVELLDFLQAPPVGDLCRKSPMYFSPQKSTHSSPAKTPVKIENYKFCSPAPVCEQTQDGASNAWHDLVNIDLGEQTKIMADITRPLSELVKTPTKVRSYLPRTPGRSLPPVTPTRFGTPGRHGVSNESNSSMTFSPSQGQLRPILESCSIVDNQVVASPASHSQHGEVEIGNADVDPDLFLQKLPEAVENSPINDTLGPSGTAAGTPVDNTMTDVQVQPPISEADALTQSSTTELPARSVTIDVPASNMISRSTPNSALGAPMPNMNAQTTAPSSTPVIQMPVSLPPAPAAPMVQPPPATMDYVLAQLPNGQYALIAKTAMMSAPVVPQPPDIPHTKRKYKQRERKNPKKSPKNPRWKKKEPTPLHPLAPKNSMMGSQILTVQQPVSNITQCLIMPQQLLSALNTSTSNVVVQPNSFPANVMQPNTSTAGLIQPSTSTTSVILPNSSTAHVNIPIPGPLHPTEISSSFMPQNVDGVNSMLSPAESNLVIAETTPVMSEKPTARKISPGLDALIRLASPKKVQQKNPMSHAAGLRDSFSPREARKAGRNSFSPLVAAAMEYQQTNKTVSFSEVVAESGVSDMPSDLEDTPTIDITQEKEHPNIKSSRRTSRSKASVVPTGHKTLVSPPETSTVKKGRNSRRVSKKSKSDLKSPPVVLPPESVISNLQGSKSEVVLSIPNSATPTIDTDFFSTLLKYDSVEKVEGVSGKRRSRCQEKGKKEKERSVELNSSGHKSSDSKSVSERGTAKSDDNCVKSDKDVSASLSGSTLGKKTVSNGNGHADKKLPSSSVTLQKKSTKVRKRPGTTKSSRNKTYFSRQGDEPEDEVENNSLSEKEKPKTHVRTLQFGVKSPSPSKGTSAPLPCRKSNQEHKTIHADHERNVKSPAAPLSSAGIGHVVKPPSSNRTKTCEPQQSEDVINSKPRRRSKGESSVSDKLGGDEGTRKALVQKSTVGDENGANPKSNGMESSKLPSDKRSETSRLRLRRLAKEKTPIPKSEGLALDQKSVTIKKSKKKASVNIDKGNLNMLLKTVGLDAVRAMGLGALIESSSGSEAEGDIGASALGIKEESHEDKDLGSSEIVRTLDSSKNCDKEIIVKSIAVVANPNFIARKQSPGTGLTKTGSPHNKKARTSMKKVVAGSGSVSSGNVQRKSSKASKNTGVGTECNVIEDSTPTNQMKSVSKNVPSLKKGQSIGQDKVPCSMTLDDVFDAVIEISDASESVEPQQDSVLKLSPVDSKRADSIKVASRKSVGSLNSGKPSRAVKQTMDSSQRSCAKLIKGTKNSEKGRCKTAKSEPGTSNSKACDSETSKGTNNINLTSAHQVQQDFEDIFGSYSPPQKLGSKTTVTSRKVSSASQKESKVINPGARNHAKLKPRQKNTDSPKKKGAVAKPKKDLLKVRVLVDRLKDKKLDSVLEAGETTPKVFSPQVTPLESPAESDEDMDVAETLVSMAMNISPKKCSPIDANPKFPENIFATPQKVRFEEPETLPDLGVSSSSYAQLGSNVKTPEDSGEGKCLDLSRSGNQKPNIFKTPEKVAAVSTERRTPRKGTPRKLVLVSSPQDPLGDLKKKDRDLYKRDKEKVGKGKSRAKKSK